jgi:hypothetical protein
MSKDTNNTEDRLRELCEQAIAADDHAEVERLLATFRLALGDHVQQARISLGSRLSLFNDKSQDTEAIRGQPDAMKNPDGEC